MRNNTKLKNLLEENDLNLSMENGEVQLEVVGRYTKTNFLVHGTSITKLLDQAIKLSKEVKSQQNRPG